MGRTRNSGEMPAFECMTNVHSSTKQSYISKIHQTPWYYPVIGSWWSKIQLILKSEFACVLGSSTTFTLTVSQANSGNSQKRGTTLSVVCTALKPGGDEQKINSEKDTTKLQNPEVLLLTLREWGPKQSCLNTHPGSSFKIWLRVIFRTAFDVLSCSHYV